jgi:hypothetical protein
VQAMNGTTCAVMVFYSDTINGQNSTATPRWIGINRLANVLDNTIDALNTIITNGASAFPSSEDDQGTLVDFTDTLTNSYNTYSTSNLTNPNPQVSKSGGVTEILPLYINDYGDYSTAGTTLNSIYEEFNTKLQGSYTLRSDAQSYVSDFQSNANDVTAQLTSVRDGMFNLQTTVNTFSNSVITTWINVVKYDKFNVINFSKIK